MPDYLIADSTIRAANVATVPQRSPLRYPGGKTWLVPHIRHWLSQSRPKVLVEPFAGGGIVSLTAVMEDLAERACMVELDRHVAAFWRATLSDAEGLASRILGFEPRLKQLKLLESQQSGDVLEQGFRTLVLNRTRRAGILAPGAAFNKFGEGGRGVASRWYPATLANRLREIAKFAHRISFYEGDGVQLLSILAPASSGKLAFFIDPPYTAGGKRAGARLYSHSEIDHARIFSTLAGAGNVNFLMTYDETPEVIEMIKEFDFHAVGVQMKNAHHARMRELVITPRPIFA